MNTFLGIRYGAFALFILLSGIIGSFSALNMGFIDAENATKRPSLVQNFDLYLTVLSIVNIVFIIPVIGIEVVRKGAATSRIWFEHVWVALFFLAYLMGAIATTMLLPKALCPSGKTTGISCIASITLIAFTWTLSSLYFIYFLTLLVYTIVRSQPGGNIWSATIVDYPWRSHDMPPALISQAISQSIDSPTKHVTVHPLKSESESTCDDEEKAVVVMLPSLGKTGPSTFGAGYTFPQRTGQTSNGSGRRYSRDVGVNAINGAPSYNARAQYNASSSYQFQAHPYRRQQSTPASEESRGHVQPPWSNGSQTPSPAVIKHVSRVSPVKPSLYPAHVVNAGLDVRQPVVPNPAPSLPPPPRQKAPVVGNLVDLLRAAGLNNGMPSPVASQRTPIMPSPSSRGHGQTQSIDSFVQVNLQSPANSTPILSKRKSSRRSVSLGDAQFEQGRRVRPVRRPPPLNLTGLSNIAKADAR